MIGDEAVDQLPMRGDVLGSLGSLQFCRSIIVRPNRPAMYVSAALGRSLYRRLSSTP